MSNRDRKTLSVWGLSLAAVLGSTLGTAQAGDDKYAITAEEHAACDGDAVSLCGGSNRDEDSVLACMRDKRDRLSPTCKAALVAGLRKRHLPF